jgi:hypothetical protein
VRIASLSSSLHGLQAFDVRLGAHEQEASRETKRHCLEDSAYSFRARMNTLALLCRMAKKKRASTVWMLHQLDIRLSQNSRNSKA